jgi:allantoinase
MASTGSSRHELLVAALGGATVGASLVLCLTRSRTTSQPQQPCLARRGPYTSGNIPHHGRYPYTAISDRADYSWPEGKRLAVYIAVNLEHFAFGEGMGAKLGGHFGEPDVLNYSWRDYGNRVGIWRLLDLLDSCGLKESLAVLPNSSIYRYAPEIMEAFRTRGAEVVGHGVTNSEAQAHLSEAEEAALIADARHEIATHEGATPEGWLAPWISQSAVSPDLLKEQGFTYHLDWCHDDQPVWMQCRDGGRILSVPYQQEINDIPHIVARQGSGADFAQDMIDAFDELLEQATGSQQQARSGGGARAGQPLVFGIPLHPYLVGQPHRLRQLRRVLQHIGAAASAPGSKVWLTTPGRVAQHVRRLEPGTE